MMSANERVLNKCFFNNLLDGVLTPLRHRVLCDNTLMLAIRNDYINIYYRGGNLLDVKLQRGKYTPSFDTNYCKAEVGLQKPTLPKSITSVAEAVQCLEAFPLMKQWIDFYLTTHKKNEREFQQLVVRENNFTPKLSNQTSYFIVDIESTHDNARFDLIAVKWPPTQQARKKDDVDLVFMEMKYGEDSIGGDSGLIKHLTDLTNAIENDNWMMELRKGTETQLNQLNDLGLITHTRPESRNFTISTKKPEVVILLANYPPQATSLQTIIQSGALDTFSKNEQYSLRFCVPKTAGYGIFEGDMIDLTAFKQHMGL